MESVSDVLLLLEQIDSDCNELQSYILVKNDDQIKPILDALDQKIDLLESNYPKFLQDMSPDADPIFRHIHFVKYFFNEKKDYTWMGSNLFDIKKFDAPSIKLRILKNSELLKNDEAKQVIFMNQDFERKKKKIFDLDLKSISSNLNQLKSRLIRAEEQFIENPNSSLQELAECIELVCREYSSKNGINHAPHAGMKLHKLVFDHIIHNKKANNYDALKYQTICSHILKRCNIKKHNFYSSNIIEMYYFLPEVYLGLFEIIENI